MITYGSTTLTSYNTITKIEVYYYKSTSSTSLAGGSWSTTKPTWENGKYIWQKIRTTYEGKLENGQYYSESDPVNITGQQGQTGTAAYSYKLNASDTTVTVSKDGVYSKTKVTFSATYKQGTGAVTAYAGRFKIETTANGTTWTTQYTSSANESSKEYTIPTGILNIRCSLYQADGTSVLLDIVSVAIVTDGTDGTNGLNNARVILYRRFSAAPSGTNVAPTGNVTYTFSTGVAANNLNSWTQNIPTGTDPVYMIAASASNTGATDTIAKTEWSAPIKILENGQSGTDGIDGYNQATIYLYQRKSGTAPAKPSSAVTYTFSTGALSSTPSGWSRTIPANDGNPCYITTATAIAKTATYSIAASAWSAVVVLSENGTSITITSTTVKYQKGTSGTTKPTGTWGTSIPSIGENEFLWTQTIVNYSDGSKTEAYSVSRNAINGTSPTVSSTTVEYQQSTGGTTPPTGTWSTTAPSAIAGQYMWTRITVKYSDNKTAVSYSVSKNGVNGIDGTDGTSQNLLLDVYATSLDKVKAPWARYLSDASNTTITGQFIAEDNLPNPNATHFYRITDSSASTKGRAFSFYNGGTPPFINGHTYRIGCWVRNHSGKPRLYITLGSINEWLPHKTIENTEWEWIECVRTFGDTDPSINTHSSTYKRLYFYLSNNNVAGSSLDMCGFKMEEVQTDISTARNYLLKTEKLDGWGVTGGAIISNGVATFPEVTANTWREIYPTKNFKYELIRNKNIIFSTRVKADTGKMCCCNFCIGVDATETAYNRQKYRNNYVYFTGDGEWHTICTAMPISDELFTGGSGTPDYDNCWVTVRIGAVNSYHNSFQLKEPQLSLGTTATSWSAAPEDVEAEISNLRTDLQSQIDEKIQTYYQSTNPATWSADERTAHDGDLWCYTGTTTSTYTKDNVYRYNASNNIWTVYSASGELFDKVDSKSTIFYGTTSDTYTDVETGDYLVDSTNGSSYRYDGSNWVKVTDYQTAINSAVTGVNLTPFFSHDLSDVYNSETNPNGYWMDNGTSYGWTKNSKFTFTQLEDGWLHVHIDNSSGTATIRNDCCVPKYNPSIKRATKYTFLVEFRNNQSTGVTSGSDTYPVQQSGSVQFWGQNQSAAPMAKIEGIGNNSGVPISEVPLDGSYVLSRFTKFSEPDGESSHWTTNDKMVTFTFRANAGAVIDYDIRLSLYEGEYWGSYTPYIISDITDIRKSAEDANEKIDNLEIGGRNLLKNSKALTDNWQLNQATVSDGVVTVTPTASGDRRMYQMPAVGYWTWTVGQEYTVSVDARSDNGASFTFVATGVSSNGTARTSPAIIVTSEWKRYSFTFTAAHSSTGSMTFSIVETSDKTIQFKEPKLEHGGKATSWTPAPEDMQADIDTALAQSVEYIIGTQTAATNLWTGVTKDTSLQVGKTIVYYLPYGGTTSAATLNLTLAGGGTTGAKNVRWNNTNVTNHYPQYSIITLTYDGTYWRTSAYNSDTINRVRMQNVIIAAENITAGHIICGTSSGYQNIQDYIDFDLSVPILYAGTTIAKGATTGTRDNNFLALSGVKASTNGTIESGTIGKILYLKGTVTGNTFHIAATPFMTTNTPNQEDDFYYIPLGIMYTTTNIYFQSSNRLYAYIDGAFQPVDTAAVLRAQDAKDRATAVYGTCSTGATTVDKIITCSNFTLFDGARIQITFTNANTAIASETTTASPTLNVNGTGRKPIKIGIEEANTANPLYWAAGATIEFVYDGSAWVLQNAPYTLYGTCDTEESDKNKVVECDGAVICKGTTIYVDMTFSNTANSDPNVENGNVTLQVADTVAKTIYANNKTLTMRSRYNWNAKEKPSFTFDGQYWQMNKDTVPAYITDNDEDGIFVHPINDTESGWSIGNAIQLFKNGKDYIKLWIDEIKNDVQEIVATIAQIRLGREDQGHLILDDEGVKINSVEKTVIDDTENIEVKELASFTAGGIAFNDTIPFKIGNDSTYVQFIDNSENGIADSLEIVADKISFRNGSNSNPQDIQEKFDNLQTDISNITNCIEINPTAEVPYVAITTGSETNSDNAGLRLEPTQLSFQLNGQSTATVTNNEMNIPTASVTNLFMQSADKSYEKIWVMRSNGHLSLKVGKQD